MTDENNEESREDFEYFSNEYAQALQAYEEALRRTKVEPWTLPPDRGTNTSSHD